MEMCSLGDKTDFGQLKKYADYVKKDPFRRGLHYPAVEEVLGDLFATRDAVEQMGASFWQPCHDDQPYALFIVRKESRSRTVV